MTVPKPTLLAYSPGHPLGYKVSDVDYNNDILQQGARTQLLIEPVTAFPASPATTDYCFRSDLGAWFRYDGTAWQQMGVAAFTTANRPAAPPTDYRYYDLTAKAVYRWTGSAYTDNMGLEAWTVVSAFTGTWIDATATSGMSTVRYRKDSFGTVWLFGSIKSGALATSAFTLPVGYRPLQYLYMQAMDASNTLARIDISTSGTFTPQTGAPGVFISFNFVFPTL